MRGEGRGHADDPVSLLITVVGRLIIVVCVRVVCVVCVLYHDRNGLFYVMRYINPRFTYLLSSMGGGKMRTCRPAKG